VTTDATTIVIDSSNHGLARTVLKVPVIYPRFSTFAASTAK
jgi:hypothetical protein